MGKKGENRRILGYNRARTSWPLGNESFVSGHYFLRMTFLIQRLFNYSNEPGLLSFGVSRNALVTWLQQSLIGR